MSSPSLQAIGVGAGDIDVVVCSHLHPDHCGCNAFFRQATIDLPRRRVRGRARRPTPRRPGISRSTGINRCRSIRSTASATSSATTVSCSFRCRAIRPGIDERARQSRPIGNAVPARLRYGEPAGQSRSRYHRRRNTWNPELLAKAFAEVRRIEAGGATMICAHDDDAVVRSLRKGADAYD